jgi:Transposase, Mutator family
MTSLGKSWSAATLACPRPEHAGSRVRFDGRYGTPGHLRQRYKCVPANGDRPHRFTEVLPREESWTGACEACERSVGVHEGPHAARHYQFVARGIAGALHAVGAGSSYREAAFVARERAQRMRADPLTGAARRTRHGSLVMDWVEVFAPVVFESYRRSDWPGTGSVLLDDVPFRVTQPNGGTSRIAFRVYCAMGYEDGRRRMWRMQAFPSKTQADWEIFLRGLGGAPQRIVCDNDLGMTAAIRAVFPQADLYFCEWHLKHALDRLLKKLGGDEPDHRADFELLRARLDVAFTGISFWRPFTVDAHAIGSRRLSDWLASTGTVVEAQFARRGLSTSRSTGTPLSTSPMDAFVTPIRDAIRPRAYALKNRERTNRMLMLMQLHANRQDDERVYATHIRQWLELNRGRPSVPRRAIVDAGGLTSLR